MNEKLRTHVTRVAFQLSLSHNQITALVRLDVMIERFGDLNWKTERGWVFDHPLREFDDAFRTVPGQQWFVTAARGLIVRGLVTHTAPGNESAPFRDIWQVTEAGRMTKGLLVEAGLWQEHSRWVPEMREPESVN